MANLTIALGDQKLNYINCSNFVRVEMMNL